MPPFLNDHFEREHFLALYNNIDAHFGSISSKTELFTSEDERAPNLLQDDNDASLSSTSTLCLQLHRVIQQAEVDKWNRYQRRLVTTQTRSILGVLILGLISLLGVILLLPVHSVIALSLVVVGLVMTVMVMLASAVASSRLKKITAAKQIRDSILENLEQLTINSMTTKFQILDDKRKWIENQVETLSIDDLKKEVSELQLDIMRFRLRIAEHNRARQKIAFLVHECPQMKERLSAALSLSYPDRLNSIYTNFLEGDIAQSEIRHIDFDVERLFAAVSDLCFALFHTINKKANFVQKQFNENQRAYENEIERLKNQSLARQTETEGLRQIQEANRFDIESAKRALRETDQLREKLDAALSHNRALVSEFSALRDEYQEMSDRNQEQLRLITDLNSKIKNLEPHLKEMSTRARRAERTRTNLTGKNKAQASEIDCLRERLSNAEEMFGREQAHFKRLQQEYNELVRAREVQVQALEDEIARLNEQNRALEKENGSVLPVKNRSRGWGWGWISRSQVNSAGVPAEPGNFAAAEPAAEPAGEPDLGELSSASRGKINEKDHGSVRQFR